MVENVIRQTSKKTWYRWSFYINIVLFIIVAVFIYLLIRDSIAFGRAGSGSDLWFAITRDVAFVGIALTLIFVQLFRFLSVIMKRSL